MAVYDYDLFVIGAGSAGVRGARLAGAMGKKVAVAESYRVGGTCVIRGCVPKKLMVYASHYSEYFTMAKGYGWSANEPSFNWEYLKDARDAEVDRLNSLYLKTLQNNNVELIAGTAKFIDAHHVEVSGKVYSAKHILIAVGSWPYMPQIEGIEHAVTSNEIFHLPKFPKTLAVVGAGFVALEFAGIFKGLGSDVRLIYRGDKLLRGFDEEVREIITKDQKNQGINLLLNANITKIEKLDDGKKYLHLDTGEFLVVDEVLFALGRKPNLADLNLEAAGVEIDAEGFIKVDDDFKTTQSHIGAVGDIIQGPALTPVALREAAAWIAAIFEGKHIDINYEFLPSAVFAQPNIAMAGYTEEAAIKKYGKDDIDIYTTRFRPMIQALTDSDQKVFLKLVVQKTTDKVLGVHMIGHDAGEVVQGLAIALTAGVTKADFDHTIGIHPTVAEDFTFMHTKRN